MRVLVCGGRRYTDRQRIATELAAIAPDMVITGTRPRADLADDAQVGADQIAATWAKATGVACEIYDAAWHVYGHAAGPRRNQRMLDRGRPNLVLAFPGGAGTRDMVARARLAGTPVIEVA
jgi:hypothetical protein